MSISNFFSTFNISASGLSAEKKQLAITAENIANASTTRTLDGGYYKRKILQKQSMSQAVHFSGELDRARIRLNTSSAQHIDRPNYEAHGVNSNGRSRIKTEVAESNDFQRVYEPGHPDADENGFVAYPDINIVSEMLELISASRAYEANITVMNATKSMAKRSMEI